MRQNTQILSGMLRLDIPQGHTCISYGFRKLQKNIQISPFLYVSKTSIFIDTISFLQSTFFLNLQNKVPSNVV